MICWPEIHMFPDKARKPFEPAAFSVFAWKRWTLPSSSNITNTTVTYIFQDTIIVARSITQLIKILNIFTSIAEEYSGQVSKLSKFVRDWHTFVKVNEERLADITKQH